LPSLSHKHKQSNNVYTDPSVENKQVLFLLKSSAVEDKDREPKLPGRRVRGSRRAARSNTGDEAKGAGTLQVGEGPRE
jgi:hypothetical protein